MMRPACLRVAGGTMEVPTLTIVCHEGSLADLPLVRGVVDQAESRGGSVRCSQPAAPGPPVGNQ